MVLPKSLEAFLVHREDDAANVFRLKVPDGHACKEEACLNSPNAQYINRLRITCIEIPRSTSSTKKKKPAISFQLALDYSPPSDDPVTPVRVANCVTPEGLSYSDAYTKFASFKKIGTCNVIDVSHRCPQFGWKRMESAKGKPDSDHYYRLIRALHDRIVGRNRSPLYICPFGCVNGAVSACTEEWMESDEMKRLNPLGMYSKDKYHVVNAHKLQDHDLSLLAPLMKIVSHKMLYDSISEDIRIFQALHLAASPPVQPLFPKSYLKEHSAKDDTLSPVDEVLLDGIFQYPLVLPKTKSGGANVDSDDEDTEDRVTVAAGASKAGESIPSAPIVTPSGSDPVPSSSMRSPQQSQPLFDTLSSNHHGSSCAASLATSRVASHVEGVRDGEQPNRHSGTTSAPTEGGAASAEFGESSPTSRMSTSLPNVEEIEVGHTSCGTSTAVPLSSASSGCVTSATMPQNHQVSPNTLRSPDLRQETLAAEAPSAGCSRVSIVTSASEVHSRVNLAPATAREHHFLVDMLSSPNWQQLFPIIRQRNPMVEQIQLREGTVSVQVSREVPHIVISDGERDLTTISLRPEIAADSSTFLLGLIRRYELPLRRPFLDLSDGWPSPIRPSLVSTPNFRSSSCPGISLIGPSLHTPLRVLTGPGPDASPVTLSGKLPVLDPMISCTQNINPATTVQAPSATSTLPNSNQPAAKKSAQELQSDINPQLIPDHVNKQAAPSGQQLPEGDSSSAPVTSVVGAAVIHSGPSHDASVLETAKDIVSCLTRAIERDASSHLISSESYSLLAIDGFPYPFVVLPCEEDGNCGYHAIVRHCYPHWSVLFDEYSDYILQVKQCAKFCILENFTEATQWCLLDAYPFLAENGSVKANYAKQFAKLEITQIDFLNLSRVLKVKFIIIVRPLNAMPSVLQLCHSDHDPASAPTIWLYQTGADVNAATRGSHYSTLFPLNKIDGQDVADMEFTGRSLITCAVASCSTVSFRNYGAKEIEHCPAIPSSSMPSPGFLLQAVASNAMVVSTAASITDHPPVHDHRDSVGNGSQSSACTRTSIESISSAEEPIIENPGSDADSSVQIDDPSLVCQENRPAEDLEIPEGAVVVNTPELSPSIGNPSQDPGQQLIMPAPLQPPVLSTFSSLSSADERLFMDDGDDLSAEFSETSMPSTQVYDPLGSIPTQVHIPDTSIHESILSDNGSSGFSDSPIPDILLGSAQVPTSNDVPPHQKDRLTNPITKSSTNQLAQDISSGAGIDGTNARSSDPITRSTASQQAQDNMDDAGMGGAGIGCTGLEDVIDAGSSNPFTECFTNWMTQDNICGAGMEDTSGAGSSNPITSPTSQLAQDMNGAGVGGAGMEDVIVAGSSNAVTSSSRSLLAQDNMGGAGMDAASAASSNPITRCSTSQLVQDNISGADMEDATRTGSSDPVTRSTTSQLAQDDINYAGVGGAGVGDAGVGGAGVGDAGVGGAGVGDAGMGSAGMDVSGAGSSNPVTRSSTSQLTQDNAHDAGIENATEAGSSSQSTTDTSCISGTQSSTSRVGIVRAAFSKLKADICQTQPRKSPYKSKLRTRERQSSRHASSSSFDDSLEMKEIRDSFPELVQRAVERRAQDEVQTDNPERLEDLWNSLSEGQYMPFSSPLSTVAPLDPEVSAAIANVSYTNPMGKLVDFVFFLNGTRRVNAKGKFTDPKKVATSRVNNQFILNSVSRFFSFVCQETQLSFTDDESKMQLFQKIEDPRMIQTFLKNLAASGRKHQSVFLYLSNLQKFQEFLVKCGILTDTGTFSRLKKDIGREFSSMMQFNNDRLNMLQSKKKEEVENFPIEKYVFLLHGEEINMVGRRWCSFDFAGATLPELRAVLDVVVGVIYLNIQAYNIARSSDNTTVEVTAFEKALKTYRDANDPDQEFLIVKGLLQHKNSFRKTKGKVYQPALVWPIHWNGFLENYLSGLKRFKTRLRLDGVNVNNRVFLINMHGQFASANELRTSLKIACEVFCVDFNSRLFRTYIQSQMRLLEAEARLNVPEAAHASHQMAAVTSHMLHTEEVAKKHYRLDIDSTSHTAGKAVKAVLSQTRKRRLPNPTQTPAKRVRVRERKDSSESYEPEGVWSRDDFKQPKSLKRMASFESRLDYFMQPSQVRKMQKEDELQQQRCEEMNVQYDPPVSNETQEERRQRRRLNNKRLDTCRDDSQSD